MNKLYTLLSDVAKLYHLISINPNDIVVNEHSKLSLKLETLSDLLVIVNFLCRDSLDLAFKYFTSSTLTVRLAGLSQITVSMLFFSSSATDKL